jgi:UDP-glucose 4-epimerase/UDP-arabinose 4-epimerase
MGRNILVVGGAGYIGAHICKALAKEGYQPVVYDNLVSGHREFVKWGELVEADIHDWGTVANTLKRYEIDAVIHLAAFAFVGESVAEPQKYYLNNVSGTLSLLRGMREADCKKLVFSSTCSVYSGATEHPLGERGADNAPNPYGASKFMVERILSDYRAAYGLQSIVLRYFNACGADPDGEIGELHDPEERLIPRAMMTLQGYIKNFAVHGDDFPTPDGTAVRDYVHVCDLADAHVAALRRVCDGWAEGTYNLGSGTGYSVKQVLDAIETETGRALPRVFGPRRPGDVPILVADPSLAKAELGFTASRSDLATIVRTAWAWHLTAHPYRGLPPQPAAE